MTRRRWAVGVVVCCAAFCAYGNDARPSSAAGGAGAVNAAHISRLIPGVTTKAQVRSLLGAPWRTVQYNDMEEPEDEIWEYRGRDSGGAFRLHIEFDRHDLVRIVGKIPETRAKPPPPIH